MSASTDPELVRRPEAHHAEVAALPLAAALTVAVARVLPIEFAYHPNELGIVSVATVQRYPLQQETFWFVFAVVLGVAAALGIAAVLKRRSWSGARGVGLEAAAIATLAAELLLPRGWTSSAWLFALGAAVLAWKAPVSAAGEARDERTDDTAPPPRARKRYRVAWLAAFVVLAIGTSPKLPIQAWRLVTGVPDEQVTADDWGFHGESGQHLAWADSIRAGRMQGRDYFSLYGPYFDLALVGLWDVAGRSLTAWSVYDAAQFAAGYLGALVVCWVVCRRRWAALALVPIARWVYLRLGLGLFALAALAPWLRGGVHGGVRGGKRAWCGAAGVIGGFTLLYSQEFGLAFLVTAALALVVRGDARALAWFAGGLVLPIAPIVAWFVAQGALGPLVRDMAAYPAWLAAGYGKLPFPSLVGGLPLDVTPPVARAAWLVRTAYVGPAVCAGAFALCAACAPLELARPWRFPLELRRAWRVRPETLLVALLAVYGLASFRSALGRNDEPHVVFVLGPAAVLLVVALDRTLGLLAAGARALGAWRLLWLCALAWFGGFPRAADSFASLRECAANAWSVVSGRAEAPRGDERVNEVAAWLRAHTAPDDPVTFVPAGAAYQYLSERHDPTRFVLSHQMVTDAHRAEALAALERSPPRYVVFDPNALRVDGIPDRIVLGSQLSDWLASHYELETTIRGVRIHRRKSDVASDDPRGDVRAPAPK